MARAPNPTRSRRAPASASVTAPAAGSGKRKVPEAERPEGDGGGGGGGSGGGGSATGGAAAGAAEGAEAAAATHRGVNGKPHGGTLFLVPQALMCQWKAEVARHAPSLSCCIISTTPSGEIIPRTQTQTHAQHPSSAASTDEHPSTEYPTQGGGLCPLPPAQVVVDDGSLATLVDMGFDPVSAREALITANGDVANAIEILFGGGFSEPPPPSPPPPPPPPPSSPPPPPEGSAAWLAAFDVVICSHAVLSKLPW